MADLLSALPAPETFDISGAGHRPSAFAVSELATASIASVGVELAGLIAALNLAPTAPRPRVDHRLASLWFGYSFRPTGWEMPGLWDAVAGDYWTKDGWIRLHTNLPRHREAALRVLGCERSREAVESAVASWSGNDLESAIVGENGVAAAMRSREDWLAHPQGQAVSAEPLVGWRCPRKTSLRDWPASIERPLLGLRVLDLTRVLAGPISTRTLAGFGADVLRVDPPGWDEPGVIPDISLGKRCTYLDLTSAEDRERFETLLAQADVLVHGYRPGALDGLGYGRAVRDSLAPNRVEVTLDAYGWQGPWAQRRGFDSLVQMSAGIAHAGIGWAGADKPTPLPVQALDHAAGYMMAAAVLSALAAAAKGDEAPTAHFSLARTAELLASMPKTSKGAEILQATNEDYAPTPEQSGWGPGQRLIPPLSVGETGMSWTKGAAKLGTAQPSWA